MSISEKLLTADEFQKLDDGRRLELERGEIVVMNQPGLRHGRVCTKVGSLVDQFVDKHQLGQVFNNDAGIVTTRDPDTVRGPDVMYYSYQRLPKEDLPEGYADVAPEVVFEVLSPDDRPRRVIRKIAEYLSAGVLCVVVLDPESRTVSLHRPGQVANELAFQDTLLLPEIADHFEVPVAKFFG